ncbi:MAG: type 4a pilus biogenesis protein PilO [bacterium]|nr:type 4a pilus biogenesis protein PilO [bacterium]
MSPMSSSRKLILLFNKYYYVILVVLVLAILGGGYYFFIQERIAEIQKVGTVDLDSKLNTKATAQRNLDKLLELNENYSKISQSELKKLSGVLPKKSEIPFLIIELDRFIAENDLELNSLDIGPLSGENDSQENVVIDNAVKELKISLSIAGIESYFELKNFLQIMSEQLPLIELSSLNYNEATTAYNLNLTTYYQ